MLYKKVNQDFLSKTKNDSCEKKSFLRPCDTDTYFRNIIFSNISEILFMCITDYFKLFSRSCAIKTLNLKFLTESKVKKNLYSSMAAKMTDELEITYMSFCPSYTVIMELDTKKMSRRKIWTRKWVGWWSGTREEFIMEF